MTSPRTETQDNTRANEWYGDQAAAAREPALAEAGKTLSSYVYSLMNPGAIPEHVRTAMRVFEDHERARGGPVQGEPVPDVDELHERAMADHGLVFESYGAGMGWFRA